MTSSKSILKIKYLPLIMLVCGDILALVAALAAALRLRFDSLPFTEIYSKYIHNHLLGLSVAIISYVLFFAVFRLYKYAWRFASLETLWGVVLANSMGFVSLIFFQYLFTGYTLPYSVLIIFYIFSIALVGGARILLRLVSLGRSYGSRAVGVIKQDLRPKRVIIMGSGPTAVRVLNAIRDEMNVPYQIVGMLDDRPQRAGIYVRDIKVLGPLSHLFDLLETGAIDEVLVALPEASGSEIREYVVACRKHSIPVKVIQALTEVLNGTSPMHFEEISVEDLLRRPPVRIKMDEISSYLTGKRILVTGAGGSIGSELCRQIIAMDPAKLILLGHGENSIHLIQQELQRRFPRLRDRICTVIGSVADEVRMNQVFKDHMPNVVFHTAAHKHVPIMESNLLEAAQNNVLGTGCVAQCCGAFGIKKMVLISSDKAVNPSCIMGATKWLSEEILRAKAAQYLNTEYVTVRFGNVLGSRGSVVPIFKEQIKNGGPVTITHPEMTRYFMSIPEAVQLVLQAGAIGHSGELYLLDMGKPIRVMDLAYDMIRLCGYEPDVDIQIEYTGIRPGEKLHEQLSTTDDLIRQTSCAGLSMVERNQAFERAEFSTITHKIKDIVSSGDTIAIQDLFDEIIPGFGTRTLLKQTMPKVEDYDPASHL